MDIHINFANCRRIQSKDLSLAADDTSASTTTSLTSLSRLSAPGSIEGVKEIQPLGGPKYYVMVNTKKGQAKIAHEGMPAAGREGFIMDMEEKGFEIMEYDLLVPGRHRHHDKKNDGNHHCKSCGLTTNETIMMRFVMAKTTFVMPKQIGEGTEEGCKDRHAKKQVTHNMFIAC